MTCVDRRPRDPEVVSMDVMTYLTATEPGTWDMVTSKNLLEHLPDPGRFIELCARALRIGGHLKVITDNAEWLPFYAPFWVKHLGIGAHRCNDYAIDFCASMHYSIFTTMHLRNLFYRAGLEGVKVGRDPYTLGARIWASGFST
jgi:SAM-dependent methyltransferase